MNLQEKKQQIVNIKSFTVYLNKKTFPEPSKHRIINLLFKLFLSKKSPLSHWERIQDELETFKMHILNAMIFLRALKELENLSSYGGALCNE